MTFYSFEAVLKRERGIVYTSIPGGEGREAILKVGNSTVSRWAEDLVGSCTGYLQAAIYADNPLLHRYRPAPLITCGLGIYGEELHQVYRTIADQPGADSLLQVVGGECLEAWNRAGEAFTAGTPVDEHDLYAIVTGLNHFYVDLRMGKVEEPKIPCGNAPFISFKEAFLKAAADEPIINSITIAGVQGAKLACLREYLAEKNVVYEEVDEEIRVPGFVDVWKIIGAPGPFTLDLAQLNARTTQASEPQGEATTSTQPQPLAPSPAVTRTTTIAPALAGTKPRTVILPTNIDDPLVAAAAEFVLVNSALNHNKLSAEQKIVHTYGAPGLEGFEAVSKGVRSALSKRIPLGATQPEVILEALASAYIEAGVERGDALIIAAGYLVRCKGQWIFTANEWRKK